MWNPFKRKIKRIIIERRPAMTRRERLHYLRGAPGSNLWRAIEESIDAKVLEYQMQASAPDTDFPTSKHYNGGLYALLELKADLIEDIGEAVSMKEDADLADDE